MRKCSGCSTTKSLTEFYRDKSGTLGWDHICKGCRRKMANARRIKVKKQLAAQAPQQLVCSKCTLLLDVSCFYTHPLTNTGRNPLCKSCYLKTEAERRKTYPQEQEVLLSKTCKGCGRRKRIQHFYARTSMKDGYSSYCRKCKPMSEPPSARKWRKTHVGESLYGTLQARAKRKGEEYLPKKDFLSWYTQTLHTCRYCDLTEEDSLLIERKHLTVDRMDNLQGYSLNNITLACFTCNRAKSDVFTFTEWLEIAQKYLKLKR